MRNSNRYQSGQGELSFGLAFRSAVLTMLRWHPSRFLVGGGCHEGKLASVGYAEWLAFYTPLCERGQS